MSNIPPELTTELADGLNSFIKKAWRFPILSHEEEYTLVLSYQETGNQEAADQLVNSHLRLVVKIAMGYKGYGLPVADLIAEGNIGLLKSLKKFEPERGFRLSTYAMWWIRASVGDYILKNWSMVPLGTISAQKKLFFSLGRVKRKLSISGSENLNDEQISAIASETNASPADVKQINLRMNARDKSLNMPVSFEDSTEKIVQIVDERMTPDIEVENREQTTLRHETLNAALSTLQERDQAIVRARFLSDNPPSLKDLGIKYGISSERVRQLEARSLEILRSFLRQHVLFPHLRFSTT